MFPKCWHVENWLGRPSEPAVFETVAMRNG